MIWQDKGECPFCLNKTWEYNEDLGTGEYDGHCTLCGYYQRHGFEKVKKHKMEKSNEKEK